MHREDFQNIDRRPARHAGQAKTETIGQIADLDRRDGAQRSARVALLTLAASSAVVAWHQAAEAPGFAAGCILACAVALFGLFSSRGDL